MPHLMISIALLHPHPENANSMPPRLLDKLAHHIERSGDYPAIIVRAHPAIADAYEILDGHHRVQALRQLGAVEARCDVWQADDERARLLLLTLNRLQGQDDPAKRGGLIERLLNASPSVANLERWLPDDAARLQRLVKAYHPPPELIEPRPPDEMPVALTFFLTARQREQALARLSNLGSDRSAALLRALNLS